MSTLVSSEDLQTLIKTFETKSELLPTPLDLYRLGLALHDLPQESDLIAAYDAYLQTFPQSFLSSIMKELTRAFGDVVLNADSGMDDIRKAVLSIGGLCCHSGIACQAGYSIELCSTLASVYCTFSKRSNEYETERETMKQTLNHLLSRGLLKMLTNMDQEIALQRTMELAQAMTADDKNTFLGDALQSSDGSFVVSIRKLFDETPGEREYLIRMLESSPKASDFVIGQLKNAPPASAPTPPIAKIDSQTEIERRIQQVKDVLPDLGDGYIETALSCFGGDVSSTVTALLDPTSLPPTLQFIDSKLPARRKETAKSTAYELNDQEMRTVVKERFATMERIQEAEAFALTAVHNEYDDDYDDQYDGMDADGDLGGKGSTYDDVDISHVKIYNRIARETEREQEFWEESRNTNRQRKQQPTVRKEKSDDDDDDKEVGKVYRGPDKIKGGRPLGPDGKVLPRQRGGKSDAAQSNASGERVKQEQGTQAASNEMSKIQKRRKNDNKAKIGNHHRKDKAQKKQASFGL
jgi:CUE domain